MDDLDLEVAADAFSEVAATGRASIGQLVAAVRAAGPRVFRRFGRPNDSFELAFVDAGIKLDLFFSYPTDGGQRWIGGIDAKNLQKFKWTYASFDVCWTALGGLKLGIPCDPIPYLVAFYGPNWHEPLKGTWDYRTGHPNLQLNGRWPKEQRNEVVRTQWP